MTGIKQVKWEDLKALKNPRVPPNEIFTCIAV
jgi:hypothetical protein